MRNGNLNQMAYSLFLFIRDVADGDLVTWIDRQLAAAENQPGDRLANLRRSLVEPVRQVYGISDKVAAMALSSLLISARSDGCNSKSAGAPAASAESTRSAPALRSTAAIRACAYCT